MGEGVIPTFYKANETNFTTYGLGALSDTISYEVTEERNGAFECTFKYPVTGANYDEIKRERLVKVKVNDTSALQVFRIYRITTPLNGIVKICAQHISYDLSSIATPVSETETMPPQLAIESVFQKSLTPHNFTFKTDYTGSKAFSVEKLFNAPPTIVNIFYHEEIKKSARNQNDIES